MLPPKKEDDKDQLPTDAKTPVKSSRGVVLENDDLEILQAEWTDLFKHQLPLRARERKSVIPPVTPKWPVSLDHCFARIILDNAVGKDTPWMSKVKAPATRNMSKGQILDAIKLGKEILDDSVDLGILNKRSLELRGKEGPSKAKRKRDLGDGEGSDGPDKHAISSRQVKR